MSDQLGAEEGKYLTFALGAEQYGLEILKVREIIGMMPVTQVPQVAPEVKGVINLRGQVITVVDLRLKFEMETVELTEETCIIVVENTRGDRQTNTGIMVDKVLEVLDIPANNIEQSPSFGGQVNTEYILGMAKVNEQVKILLDIDRVLNSEEMAVASIEAAP